MHGRFEQRVDVESTKQDGATGGVDDAIPDGAEPREARLRRGARRWRDRGGQRRHGKKEPGGERHEHRAEEHADARTDRNLADTPPAGYARGDAPNSRGCRAGHRVTSTTVHANIAGWTCGR